MIVLLALAALTLVSEDLASIAAGLMVSRGEVGFAGAALACFVGIYVGDLLLFLAGRHLGRPFLARAPLRWLVGPDDAVRASAWLRRRGPIVVFLSRFTPGARLPTYLAAGLLDTRLASFALWLAIAAAAWTPLLVGAAAVAGAQGLARIEAFQRSTALFVLLGGGALFVTLKLLLPAFTHRGRRLLLSSWLRATRFEFWPPWILYAPVVPYILGLGLKHRSLTVFTAANPAMEAGGFIGESKAEILRALERGGAPVAPFRVISGKLSPEAKLDEALSFMRSLSLGWPVVLKPDVGERGRGVAVVHDEAELRRRLPASTTDLILQEYVPGVEFGIFYVRHPDESRGRIFGVTEKIIPAVTADGVRSVERLVLEDARGVLMGRFHLRRLADRLDEVPAAGVRIPLAEIGTHCRGAIFLDGAWALTPALEEAVERASRGYSGFHFGRYDVRASSVEALQAGGFTILELNGVTSEATEIYDPRNGVLAAWRKLFAQWRLVFEIGAANRVRGAAPANMSALLRPLISRIGPGRARFGERVPCAGPPTSEPSSNVIASPIVELRLRDR